MKRLTLCKDENAMICGVFGGIADYLEADPTIVRFIGIFIIFSGVGILPYFLAAWIMPDYVDVSPKQE